MLCCRFDMILPRILPKHRQSFFLGSKQRPDLDYILEFMSPVSTSIILASILLTSTKSFWSWQFLDQVETTRPISNPYPLRQTRNFRYCWWPGPSLPIIVSSPAVEFNLYYFYVMRFGILSVRLKYGDNYWKSFCRKGRLVLMYQIEMRRNLKSFLLNVTSPR